MGSRGRRSANDLAVIPIRPDIVPLQAPANLTAKARKIFREALANAPRGHFSASDVQLLATYATATAIANDLAKQAQKNPAMVLAWSRAVRAQIAVATKLRLTPHSRSHAITTARKMASQRPKSFYD
jgi:phage terminase small subunit